MSDQLIYYSGDDEFWDYETKQDSGGAAEPPKNHTKPAIRRVDNRQLDGIVARNQKPLFS